MFNYFSASILLLTIILLPVKAEDITINHIGPDINQPWGMDFISNNEVIVTEKSGNIFRININNGEYIQVSNTPKISSVMQGGLLDIIFDDYRVYLCYSKDTSNGTITAIDSAILSDDKLINLKTIFESNTSGWTDVHFGCRLEINNRKLHATLGDRGNRYNAQDTEKHGGSVIRLNLDGSIPKDNPKLEGWAPEIYSIGHRNPQGIIINPITGEIWTHEHGPQGGDEINIIIPGDNYGWPLVSHGYEYGTENRVSKYNSLDGFNDPEWVWLPSIAPSGMAFYPSKDMTKKMFPELNKTLLVGSLKFRRLYVLELNDGGLPTSESILIDGSIGRVRDVAVAIDGSILLLNDESSSSNPKGGLYRVSR